MSNEHVTLKFIPDAMKTSIIKVFRYENQQVQGSFYNLYYGEEIKFDNLMQLLLIMENMMDEIRYPAPAVESRLIYKKRGFSHEALSYDLLPGADGKHEVLETFRIRVLYRQNASWQGTISWKTAGQTYHFRSALELFKMMDNVLSEYTELSKIQEMNRMPG